MKTKNYKRPQWACWPYCHSGGTRGRLGVERCQFCLQDTFCSAKCHYWVSLCDSVDSSSQNSQPFFDCISDNTAFRAATLSWQDPVHSWKTGPSEVITVENLFRDCSQKGFPNPIPTGHGRIQPIYERPVTKSGRNRVKRKDCFH